MGDAAPRSKAMAAALLGFAAELSLERRCWGRPGPYWALAGAFKACALQPQGCPGVWSQMGFIPLLPDLPRASPSTLPLWSFASVPVNMGNSFVSSLNNNNNNNP